MYSIYQSYSRHESGMTEGCTIDEKSHVSVVLTSKDSARKNMAPICLTLDVSHIDNDWLNTTASLNIALIVTTLLVFQCSIG